MRLAFRHICRRGTERTGGRLSETAALIALWSREGDCYQTPPALAYLSSLDLSAGTPLFTAYNRLFPYAQVVHNRKWGVQQSVRQFATQNRSRQWQLVSLGAGTDPLSIDLAATYKNLTVWEIDREQMTDKQSAISALSRQYDPPLSQRIHCCAADIADTKDLLRTLLAHGWSPDLPTLLLLEGITYYISPATLSKVAATLQPDALVCDILKDEREISPERAHIPRAVFGDISAKYSLPPATRYSRADLEQILPQMTCTAYWQMCDLEQQRTGARHHFPTAADGWIAVAFFQRAAR